MTSLPLFKTLPNTHQEKWVACGIIRTQKPAFQGRFIFLKVLRLHIEYAWAMQQPQQQLGLSSKYLG